MISPKLVEVGRHINIDLLTNSELLELKGEPGNFTAVVRKTPRFVDLAKCTSCGECTKVCPIETSNDYDEGLSRRKAIFKQYAQAMPGAYGINKRGTAPCKATCPAHVSVQGYIALINAGKYQEALDLFREDHPFPGVCGRVCHHPCEKMCTRNDVDQPLAIRELHRFLCDYELSRGEPVTPPVTEALRTEKVAVIGSGPAGLAAAYALTRRGYSVTVFEKLPIAGGMMAVGIPAYRLPRDILNLEIEVIRRVGVEIRTGVTFGRDITLESLKQDGFKAVFLAIGLHGGRRLGVENEDVAGVLQGVDFLRDAALGKTVEIGADVLVVGGGNVAVDVALTAKRLGAKNVTMVCLERREEMPAWTHEIQEALESDIRIVNSFGPKAFFIDKSKRVSGLEFKTCTAVFDENRRFNPQFDESVCTPMFADTVIIAIGQSTDRTHLDGQGIVFSRPGGLQADPVTLQTPIEGVFAGGDAFHGPKSVVEAVASGKEAAESIHRYLNGLDLRAGRAKEWEHVKPETAGEAKHARVPVRCLDPAARECNFLEVSFGYDETEARMESQRCLRCGICSECYQCVKACLAKAVDHTQEPEILEIPVGSVILCPGSDPYDPSRLENIYHYRTSPNVLTSLEFERILSATGPTMGHLKRLADDREPKRIAWLQCIGSRDNNQCGNGYCSSVCCMYAMKDAMIAKEHAHGDLECTIFNMDIRSFGKDYEKYYNRAIGNGIRFVRSRVHSVDVLPETGNLSLRYADEAGGLQVEEYDMVVLSVGLQIPKETVALAERLKVELNPSKFAQNRPFTPVETSRPGVYACGVFQGPKDIPSSVTEAGAAAVMAAADLAEARGRDVTRIQLPEELDVSAEAPRVGVFVCNCGINIGGIVDVPGVRAYAEKLPHVVYADENLFTCSQDTQEKIKEKIKEHKLNRVVVASCSPKTHAPMFMETLEACGLNPYLFEMANIRNQDSWVHSDDRDAATRKAKDLVRMSAARAATLKMLTTKSVPIHKQALVIGGGVAGMNAALSLARQGFPVVVVEKEAELGGFARRLHHTIEGADIPAYLKELAAEVTVAPEDPGADLGPDRRIRGLQGELRDLGRARGRGGARPDRARRHHRRDRRRRVPAVGAPLRPGPAGGHAGGVRRPARPPRGGRAAERRDDPVRGVAQRDERELLAHLLPERGQERARAQEAQPRRPGVRPLPGHPHLRADGGVLHRGPQAGRHLHPLRARGRAAGFGPGRGRRRAGEGPRAAAGHRDPGRPAGAERRRGRGRHGRRERAHEAQPQPGGILHRGPREAATGRHAERGRLPLRDRPRAQADLGDDRPGAGGSRARIDPALQGLDQALGDHGQGGDRPLRQVSHLRAVLPVRGAAVQSAGEGRRDQRGPVPRVRGVHGGLPAADHQPELLRGRPDRLQDRGALERGSGLKRKGSRGRGIEGSRV